MVAAAPLVVAAEVLGVQKVGQKRLTDVGAGGPPLERTFIGAAEQGEVGKLGERGLLKAGNGTTVAPALFASFATALVSLVEPE